MTEDRPLEGLHITALTTNVPGPVAAARLAALGATVTRIEPPAGDALALVAPHWYAELTSGMDVVRLDLRTDEGRQQARTHVAAADLMLTTFRQRFLAEAGLDHQTLARQQPDLAQVLIVGAPPPDHERPAHDLTCQAAAGLLDDPRRLPPTLMVDLLAAERAVAAALTLLLARERGQPVRPSWVALAESAAALAAPRRHGLTKPGGLLGGGLSTYRCYRTADEGWVACALLEPKFVERARELLDLEELDEDDLAARFRARTTADWREFAASSDLPMAVLEPADR